MEFIYLPWLEKVLVTVAADKLDHLHDPPIVDRVAMMSKGDNCINFGLKTCFNLYQKLNITQLMTWAVYTVFIYIGGIDNH